MNSRIVCQRPKRAYFISTQLVAVITPSSYGVCQRPKRAYFISTIRRDYDKNFKSHRGVNALNGLTSFLRYPLKPLENTGFPASFLQVFVRLF